MKKLLMMLMVISPSIYAVGHGGHVGHVGHSSHSESHFSHNESHVYSHTLPDADVVEYTNHYNNTQHQINWKQNWSIFNQSSPKITKVVDDEDDCKQYKQYSSSNNLTNCDFDGNVQQYKEYSTHK